MSSDFAKTDWSVYSALSWKFMVEVSSILCAYAVVYSLLALAVMHVVFNCFRERQWKCLLPLGRNNWTSRSSAGWSLVSWEMNKWVFLGAVISKSCIVCAHQNVSHSFPLILRNLRKGKNYTGIEVGFGTFLMMFLQWAAADVCSEDFVISMFSTSKWLTVEIEEDCTKPWTHSDLCAELVTVF